MAKTVFRPTEITKSDKKVMLQLNHNFVVEPEVPEVEQVPEYTGPTADDLRREAEAFKKTGSRKNKNCCRMPKPKRSKSLKMPNKPPLTK